MLYGIVDLFVGLVVWMFDYDVVSYEFIEWVFVG